MELYNKYYNKTFDNSIKYSAVQQTANKYYNTTFDSSVQYGAIQQTANE